MRRRTRSEARRSQLLEMADDVRSQIWLTLDVKTLSRLDCTCWALRGTLEATLRLHAARAGCNAQAQCLSLPPQETSVAEYLFYCHEVRRFRRTPLAATACASFIVDRDGHLLSCGSTDLEHMVAANEAPPAYSCHLGRGPRLKSILLPEPIPLRLRIWSCAAGSRHCLALSEGGHVFSWGDNHCGQLGCGSVGYGHGAPKAVSGQWYVNGQWTPHTAGRVGFIAATENYSVCICTKGRLYEWGETPWQPPIIGLGAACMAMVPRWVVSPALQPGAVGRLTDLAVSSNHILVVTDRGFVLSWGDGNYGALGHDELWRVVPGGPTEILPKVWDESEWRIPKVVERLADLRIVAVAASDCTSLAVSDDGQVFGWGGDGWTGTAGHGNGDAPTLPTPIPALAGHRVVSVFMGASVSTAVTADGRIFSWGLHDKDCLLGHGPSVGEVWCPMVEQQPPGAPPQAFDPGPQGDERVLYQPTVVAALAGQSVCHIACPISHTLAMTSQGEVYSWGSVWSTALGLSAWAPSLQSLIDDTHRVVRRNAVSTYDPDTVDPIVEYPTIVAGVCAPCHRPVEPIL